MWAATLGVISGLICIGTSIFIDIPGFDFEFNHTKFGVWLLYVGQSLAGGGVFVWWAFRKIYFRNKTLRYIFDFYMELSIVDFIHTTFFIHYVFYWSQWWYLLYASLILIIKLLLNRYWHWFKIQELI